MDDETIVVYSPALKLNTHPELLKAQEMNLRIYEYQEMLGLLTKKLNAICISGCHGKTTTTSMLSHVMSDIEGCNYIIGDGSGHGDKNSDRFVLEACEYRRHFLAYDPEYVVITNIDMDHPDYYKDMDDIISAYQEFANKANKMIIACGDDPYTHSINVNPQIYYYGINEENDIQARDIEYKNDGISFDVFVEDEYYGHFDLPLFGKHMLLNALAVIAVCHYERLDAKDVAKSLKTFKGSRRRFEETIIGDVVIVDDYAHHPNEIRATIKAARQKYPDKKIVAVFEPHTFSRTKEFAEEFAKVFNTIDKTYIMDVFPARETQDEYPEVNSNMIIDLLENGEYINDEMVEKLDNLENSVVLFMSPKEIYVLKEKYKKLLEEKNK